MVQPCRRNAKVTVKQIQVQLLGTQDHTQVGLFSLIQPNVSTQGPSSSLGFLSRGKNPFGVTHAYFSDSL